MHATQLESALDTRFQGDLRRGDAVWVVQVGPQVQDHLAQLLLVLEHLQIQHDLESRDVFVVGLLHHPAGQLGEVVLGQASHEGMDVLVVVAVTDRSGRNNTDGSSQTRTAPQKTAVEAYGDD